MEDHIVGRVGERKLLKKVLDSSRPEFLAIYGRRRVGKTFLIHEFFENQALLFEMTGSTKTSLQSHLQRFAIEACDVFNTKLKNPIENWDDAMLWLVELINEKLEMNALQKVVIFFDEVPWLEGGGSGFLSSLDYLWNKYLSKSKYSQVKLVICGSAASWMIKEVIHDKGGLHNRVTESICLRPFSLAESKCFLESQGVNLDIHHVTELYMALGGIPSYLIKAEPGMSATQIIGELCFSQSAFFRDEFAKLLSSLFDNHHNHVQVVRVLGSHSQGMSREDLLKKANLSNGGESSLILKELEESGFIQARSHLKNKKKLKHYFLIDEYCLFYMRWIENARVANTLTGINSWNSQAETQSYKTWAGLAFEVICFKHVYQIKKALGISGVLTMETGFFYRPRKSDEFEAGCQVDIVLQRSDRTTHLCEIKYYGDVLKLTKVQGEQLQYKKKVYKFVSKSRDLILTTLITANGAQKSPGYLSSVDNELCLEDLFDV